MNGSDILRCSLVWVLNFACQAVQLSVQSPDIYIDTWTQTLHGVTPSTLSPEVAVGRSSTRDHQGARLLSFFLFLAFRRLIDLIFRIAGESFHFGRSERNPLFVQWMIPNSIKLRDTNRTAMKAMTNHALAILAFLSSEGLLRGTRGKCCGCIFWRHTMAHPCVLKSLEYVRSVRIHSNEHDVSVKLMLPLWKAYEGSNGWTLSFFGSGAVSLFYQQRHPTWIVSELCRPAWKETQGCLFSNAATWPSSKSAEVATWLELVPGCLKSHGSRESVLKLKAELLEPQ